MNDARNFFYMFDENNFVKLCYLKMEKGLELEIFKDYYVNPEFFATKSTYSIYEGILYDKFTGYLLQEKEDKTEDLAISWNISDFGYDQSVMQPGFPKYSSSSLLYYGQLSIESECDDLYEGIILPLFNKPELYFRQLDQYFYSEINLSNLFYYDEDYIVYREKYNSNFQKYDVKIFKMNGEPIQELEIKMESDFQQESQSIVISPSGKYYGVLEQEGYDYYSCIKKMKIYELIQDPHSKEFKFELRKRIDDIIETYGIQLSNLSKTFEVFFISDEMEIFFYQTNSFMIKDTYPEIKLLYEGVDLTESILKLNTEFKEENKLDDKFAYFKAQPKNGGLVVKFNQKVHYFGVSTESQEVSCHIKFNFDIDLVYLPVDPDLLVLVLVRGDDYLTVIWNVKHD